LTKEDVRAFNHFSERACAGVAGEALLVWIHEFSPALVDHPGKIGYQNVL
jgi:hypothetical protein